MKKSLRGWAVIEEFAVPRAGGLPGDRWKITAWFRVVTGEGFPLQCVRLRPPHNGSSVYYTKKEFEKQFRLVRKPNLRVVK